MSSSDPYYGSGAGYAHYPTAPLYPQPAPATSIAPSLSEPAHAHTNTTTSGSMHHQYQYPQPTLPPLPPHQHQQQSYMDHNPGGQAFFHQQSHPPAVNPYDNVPEHFAHQHQQDAYGHAMQYHPEYMRSSSSTTGFPPHFDSNSYAHYASMTNTQPKMNERISIPYGTQEEGEDGAALFKLSLEKDDGSVESAVIQIALDGLKIYDGSGERVKRIYSFDVITSWRLKDYTMPNGNKQDRLKLMISTKSSVDEDEKTFSMLASSKIVRLLIDTLTCTIMQVCEMLGIEPGEGDSFGMGGVRVNGGEVKNTLAGKTELIKKIAAKTEQDAAKKIEFWTQAEKSGWMMSQGELIKTWRKRYFILKQRHLFRFLTAEVNSSTKARGVIDLSQLTAVEASTEEPYNDLRHVLNRAVGSKKLHVLTLKGSNVSFKLAFDNAADQEDWGIALRSAADSVSARRMTHSDFVQQLESEVESSSANATGSTASQGVVNLNVYETERSDHSTQNRRSNSTSNVITNPAPTIRQSLPDDLYKWVPAYTTDGKVYYYNTETRETRWELS